MADPRDLIRCPRCGVPTHGSVGPAGVLWLMCGACLGRERGESHALRAREYLAQPERELEDLERRCEAVRAEWRRRERELEARQLRAEILEQFERELAPLREAVAELQRARETARRCG